MDMKYGWPFFQKATEVAVEAAAPGAGKAGGKAIAKVAEAAGDIGAEGVKVLGGAVIDGMKTGISVTGRGITAAAGAVNYTYNSVISFWDKREHNKQRSISKLNALAYNKTVDEIMKELGEHISKNLIKITDQQLEAVIKYSSYYTSDDTKSTIELLNSKKDKYQRAAIIFAYIKDQPHKEKNMEFSHQYNGFYKHIVNLWMKGIIFQEYFEKPTEITEDFSMEIDEKNPQSASKP